MHELSKKHIVSFIASLDIRQSSKNTYQRQLKEFFAWYAKKGSGGINREHVLRYKDYLKTERGAFSFHHWRLFNGGTRLFLNRWKGYKGIS